MAPEVASSNGAAPSEFDNATVQLADGELISSQDAPLGGQAVLEGVMMRGASTWSVAVRKPSEAQKAAHLAKGDERFLDGDEAALGEIEVTSAPFVSVARKHKWMRWPVIRGVVALYESMKIGFQALGISADAQVPEEDGGEIGKGTWAGTVLVAVLFAVGLFFVVPVALTSLMRDFVPNGIVFVIVEKVIRLSIFLLYMWGISRIKDLQRVFEYHGAEHKTIHCYEANLPLTPENAQRFSRFHPRCGTSFLLLVMLVAILIFAWVPTEHLYVLIPSRVLGIPIVAGLSFEVLKWFGRNRTKAWARALMWPGIQLQRLTTREPDLPQLAVAIAALEAVLAVEDPRAASKEDRIALEIGA
jgi:uncharacterized protein YqhQ